MCVYVYRVKSLVFFIERYTKCKQWDNVVLITFSIMFGFYFVPVFHPSCTLISEYCVFVLDYCVSYVWRRETIQPRIRRIIFIRTIFFPTPQNPKLVSYYYYCPSRRDPKHVPPISVRLRSHATPAYTVVIILLSILRT